MPAVGAAVAAVSAWATSTTLGAIATNLLISASATALQSALARNAARRQPQPGIRTEFTTDGGVRPQSFVVGRYATAGHMVCPPMSHGRSGRNENAFLTYVIRLSDVPGASLDKVFVNDAEITFAAGAETMPMGGHIPAGRSDQWYRDNGLDPANPSAGVPRLAVGRPATGDYAGNCWLIYHDGRQTAADPYLLAAYGAGTAWAQSSDRPWLEDMVGVGTCYAILTFRLNPDLWGGQMPRCRFELGGIPLYDPRRDSTRGGTGSQRANNPASWAPSANAMVVAYNILRGIPIAGGPVWGYDAGDDALPLAEWLPAMNLCDLAVDGAPAWRAGLEIAVDQEPAEVLEQILLVCTGAVTEVAGRWKPALGAGAAPVYQILDDAEDGTVLLSSGASATPFPGLQQTFNGVHASFPDPDALWQSRDAPPRYSPALEAADDGRRLIADLSLPACPYDPQVQRVMLAYLEEGRRFRSHIVPLPPEAEILEPLDCVAVTSARQGYAGKQFRITETALDILSGEVTIAIKERDPADYVWRPDFRLPSAVLPVLKPPPALIEPQTFRAEGMIVFDAEGRARGVGARLSWAGWSLDGVAGVQWELRHTGQVLSGTMHDPERGELIIPNLLPNTDYEARIKFRGVRARWTPWVTFRTDDVRLGAADIAFEEIEREVLEVIERLEGWITGDDLAEARSEIDAEIRDLIEQVRDNVALARNYTDTEVQTVTAILVGELEQMAARLSEITAVITSDNMLANPSFVNGLDGWDIGTASVADEAATITSVLGQTVARPDGFAVGYLVQCRLEHRGGAGVLRLRFLDAGSAQLGPEITASLAASAAVRIASLEAAPPSGSAGFDLRVTTTATITIDNVSAKTIDQNVDARLTQVEAAKASLEQALATYQQTVNTRLTANEAAITAEANARSTALSSMATQMNSVSAVANSRNRTFRQTTAPTGVVAGDIWYDTSANNRAKRWSGSAWVDTRDTGIAQNAAAITAEAQARADGDRAIADSLNTVTARTNRATATGRLRVTSRSGPDGADVQLGLHAEASEDQSTHSAGVWIEAGTDGTSRIIAMANQFVLATGTGVNAARRVPFVVQGGTTFIDTALIRNGTILRAMLTNAIIGRAQVDALAVGRLELGDYAATTFPYAFTAGGISGIDLTVQSLTLQKGRADPMPIFFRLDLPQNAAATVQLRRGGTVIWASDIGNSARYSANETITVVDLWTGTTNVTYSLRAYNARVWNTSGYWDYRAVAFSNRMIGALNAFK